jgi:hypothetical protein
LSFAGDFAFRIGIENDLPAAFDLSAPSGSNARPPKHADGSRHRHQP